MLRSSDLSVSDRRHFLRRAALAPLCLCVVAGLHLFRVWTCDQTPWKGGGFGMFSTVDDESARFARCYLVTESGDLPLPIPPAANKLLAELRAAPTQHKLNELARRLAAQSWRWRSDRERAEVAAMNARRGIRVSAAVLNPAATAGGEVTPIGSQRTIEPIPCDAPPTKTIPFTEVRVECFRYRYDRSNQTLNVEPIASATAPRPLEATP